MRDIYRPYGALDIIAFPAFPKDFFELSNGEQAALYEKLRKNPADGFIISTISHVIVVFRGYGPAGPCGGMLTTWLLVTSHRWEFYFIFTERNTAGPIVGWIG